MRKNERRDSDTLFLNLFVGGAKVLKFSSPLSFLSEGVREFAVGLVYESGVAWSAPW